MPIRQDALRHLQADGRWQRRFHQQSNDRLWCSLHIHSVHVPARPLKSWPALWLVAQRKWKPRFCFMHRQRCPAAGLRPISGIVLSRSLASAYSPTQGAVPRDGLACTRPDRPCCMTRAGILYSMAASQRFVVILETTTAGTRSSPYFAARLRCGMGRRYSVAPSLKRNSHFR